MTFIDKRAAKFKAVERILANDTYMADSGLVARLRKLLRAMPAGDVANLELLMDIKLQKSRLDAVQNYILIGTPPK